MKMPEHWILRLMNSQWPLIRFEVYVKIPIDISYDSVYRVIKHIEHIGCLKKKYSEHIVSKERCRADLLACVISIFYGYEILKNEDIGWDVEENNRIKSIDLNSYYNDSLSSYLTTENIFYYYRPHDDTREKLGTPSLFALPENKEIKDIIDYIKTIYDDECKTDYPINKNEWILQMHLEYSDEPNEKNSNYIVFPKNINFKKVYKTVGYFQYLDCCKHGKPSDVKLIKDKKVSHFRSYNIPDYIEMSNILVSVFNARIINENIYKIPKENVKHKICLRENWENAMKLLKNSKYENGYPDYCILNALKHLYRAKHFYNTTEMYNNRDDSIYWGRYLEKYNKVRSLKKPTLLFKE